jgi:hypothetical protein
MNDNELIGKSGVLPSGLVMIKPEIICHPNVPKPLHGTAPRVIEGDGWWNRIRKKVYRKYDYCCGACGVPMNQARRFQRLEAHEFYKVDYSTGTVTVKSLEPLCNFCHMFIHNGRLINTLGTPSGCSVDTAKAIIEHGFALCMEHEVACYVGAIEAAVHLEMDIPDALQYYEPELNPDIQWSDWKMIWRGKEYYSKFANQEEWAAHYAEKNQR